MRLAVLTDVHSNLEALQATLAEIDKRGADLIVCLGDTVGYGPDPQACVDLIRARCAFVVKGNHDEGVVHGGEGYLPPDGVIAAIHNQRHLDAESLAWLDGLPYTETVETATLVHATPETPHLWLRAGDFGVAQRQFDHFSTPLCLAGHLHIPAVVGQRLGQLRVKPGGRYFVLVGATGQPRDHNARACVAFLDTEAQQYELVRVPYRVDETARKIVAAGLPPRLGERLKMGT